MMSQPLSRDHGNDLIKGVAVLLMIQVHIVELFAQQSLMDGWIGKISLWLGGPPVAPVFMFLLGFYALRRPDSRTRLLRRALGLLGLGVLLNVGMNLHLLTRIYLGDMTQNSLEYLLGIDILLLASLSLLIIGVLRNLLKYRPTLWAAASLWVVSLSPWMTQWTASDSTWKWAFALVAASESWSYFPLFPWLAYPLMGVAAHCWLGRSPIADIPNPRPMLLGLLAMGLPVLVVTGEFAVNVCHHLPSYYHHDLRFFVWTSLFIVVWLGAVRLMVFDKSAKWRWLAWFGQNVTACYVVQWLLIGNIATSIYKTQSLWQCALWFVFLVTLTRILVLGLARVKQPLQGAWKF